MAARIDLTTRTTCRNGHPWTNYHVRAKPTGGTERVCRICDREKRKLYGPHRKTGRPVGSRTRDTVEANTTNG